MESGVEWGQGVGMGIMGRGPTNEFGTRPTYVLIRLCRPLHCVYIGLLYTHSRPTVVIIQQQSTNKFLE